MIYPTSEYTYVDENAQNVEQSRFVQHIYTDNNEPLPSQFILDENSYDSSNQQPVQYRPIGISGSQPL